MDDLLENNPSVVDVVVVADVDVVVVAVVVLL